MAWPVCEQSGKRMVLFFQFDTRPEHGLSLPEGSHVAMFMSPTVNEIDYFGPRVPKNLPERFWEKRLRHFRAFVFPPEVALVPHPDACEFLMPRALDMEPRPEKPSGEHFLVIGGEPIWYTGDESLPGFDFVCQLSCDFPFEKRPEAPRQPGTFDKNAYCLFLGNSTYLFARPRPSDPEEVWIGMQN